MTFFCSKVRRSGSTEDAMMETNSMKKQGKSPFAKSVTFSSCAKMRFALHINDYSAIEKDDAFYKLSDFERFREEDAESLQIVEGDSGDDETGDENDVVILILRKRRRP